MRRDGDHLVDIEPRQHGVGEDDGGAAQRRQRHRVCEHAAAHLDLCESRGLDARRGDQLRQPCGDRRIVNRPGAEQRTHRIGVARAPRDQHRRKRAGGRPSVRAGSMAQGGRYRQEDPEAEHGDDQAGEEQRVTAETPCFLEDEPARRISRDHPRHEQQRQRPRGRSRPVQDEQHQRDAHGRTVHIASREQPLRERRIVEQASEAAAAPPDDTCRNERNQRRHERSVEQFHDGSGE